MVNLLGDSIATLGASDTMPASGRASGIFYREKINAQLFVAVAVVATVGLVQAAANDTIKCKADGLHLCCGQCEKSVQAILSKVDGVTAVKIDRKAADKVTFEASSDKAANDAVMALLHGGFACQVTAGDKKLTAPKVMVNLKADEITVTAPMPAAARASKQSRCYSRIPM